MKSQALRRISLVGPLLWVAVTLGLALSMTYYFERQMFREVSLAGLDYFRAIIQTLPTGTELRRFRSERDRARLKRVLAPLLREERAVTIKLYDSMGRLLYHSRAPEQIGKLYPNNANLKKALAGKSVLNVSDLTHPEQAAERRLGFDRLLEFYIPVRDSENGSVAGVYEIYASLKPFYRRFRRQRLEVWGIVLAGASLLFWILFVHFRRASRTIISQSREIEEKAENLEKTLLELKSTQDELIRSERLAMVGQLAAGVAHEVGNPLGSIMGMVDLLKRSDGASSSRREQEEYLERIGSEVMRLKRTIRALLDYARPAKPDWRPFDLNGLVEKTLPLFRIHRVYRSVDIHLDLAEPPPRVLGDDALLQQILLNLLLNAGQAMGGEGNLWVRTRSGALDGDADLRLGPLENANGEVCTLEVRDDGPGIGADLLPRIFEPFVTSQSSSERAGLGLAVCLRLIEELKGAVEVHSRPDEGAVFRIFLPMGEAPSETPQRERASVE